MGKDNGKKINYDFMMNHNRKPGIVKQAYLKCTCGTKLIFPGPGVKPDKQFQIFVTNQRGIDEDKLRFVCSNCDSVIVIGLQKAPLINDN